MSLARCLAAPKMPTPKDPRTEDFLPEQLTLPHLVEAAAACRGCSLYLRATQTVFGEGPATARVVIVGEQPGDVEDRSGRPFVGPAGKLLDKTLAEAGLDRASVYLTNAVKHFSFEERGKQRLHKKPRQSEVHACRPWLEAERR
jgi:uracil-DNA glycosylase